MKTKNIALICIALVISITIISFNTSTVNASDTFNGKITNINLVPQVIYGTGVYDHNCISVENGLTQCDAGIQTSAGLINFNYKHNMQKQPCIDEGDNIKIKILNGGIARVLRLSEE